MAYTVEVKTDENAALVELYSSAGRHMINE